MQETLSPGSDSPQQDLHVVQLIASPSGWFSRYRTAENRIYWRRIIAWGLVENPDGPGLIGFEMDGFSVGPVEAHAEYEWRSVDGE